VGTGRRAQNAAPGAWSATGCTLQLAAGTNPKIVSEVLGHKEYRIGSTPIGVPIRVPKGSSGRLRENKTPDPSVDRVDEGGFGTAYRIRTGDLRLERAVS
jgi:hypothetical protein